MQTETSIPELEILRFFNETTGRSQRPLKSNLTPIKARLKDGYTIEEIKKVIVVKTLDWKNNPDMSKHLCIETIFRPSKFEKYLNQVLDIEQNPKLYQKHYEKLNKIERSAADDVNDLKAMFGG